VEPDAAKQENLARARELRADGLGYLKIAGQLHEEGRLAKRGGPWQAASVQSVLLSSEKMALGSSTLASMIVTTAMTTFDRPHHQRSTTTWVEMQVT
jgi:hypothetical protein